MRKFFIYCTSFIFTFFLFIFAGGLLSFAAYKVPVGKSIFLRDKKLDLNNAVWCSENPNVVSISDDGVALALKTGKGKISVKKDGNVIASYDLDVIEPENIKGVFLSQNNLYKDEKVEVFAITNSFVKKVKFIIETNGSKKIYTSTSSKKDGNNLIYSASFKVPDCTSFCIDTEAYNGKLWTKSSCSKRNYLVSKDKNNNSKSVNLKRPSTKCINFIMNYEGFKSSISKDKIAAGDVFDIGYGNVINFGETFYNNITQKEAYSVFLNKVNNGEYASSVNSFLISNNIMFNQHQFDALVSFTYNLGTSWMTSPNIKDLRNIILKCKDKDFDDLDKNAFIKEFLSWHHCAKKCYKGLLYRRIDELEIFFYNDYIKDGNLNKHKFKIPDCIVKEYGQFINC